MLSINLICWVIRQKFSKQYNLDKVYHRKWIVCLTAVLIFWLYLTIRWTKQHRISEYLNSSPEHGMIIYQSVTLHKIFFTKTREKSAGILITWTFLRIPEIKQIFTLGFWRSSETTQILSTTRQETDDRYWVCARIFIDVNHPQVVYNPAWKKYKYMTCNKSFLIHMIAMTASTWQTVC